MRSEAPSAHSLRQPALISKATELQTYLQTLSETELAKTMHISAELARKTHATIAAWGTSAKEQTVALDSFVGDIYSGLQVSTFSKDDREYADKTLRILSGLYGIIRPLDGICPYRLEMGYRLPDSRYRNLYTFWGESIAQTLPSKGIIVNASSVEYSKTITPFVDPARVIIPKFLTIDPKTKEPTFKVVHAKIARGAFARWLIQQRVTNIKQCKEFAEIGYRYNAALSTPQEPVFVCQAFGGIGLSMRLR